MLNVIDVKDIQEYNEIVSKGKVIVIVYATWCGPCRFTMPILEEVSQEEDVKHISFYKMDSDKHKDITKELRNRGIPMMIFYEDGIELRRIVGMRTKEEIKKWIEDPLY
jgi:thioredoxin 1